MNSKKITKTNTAQTFVDNYLKAQDEERSRRERSGKWNPSSFGRCYRYQFWNRKNEKPSNPIDTRTLRIFQAGKLFHDFVQSKIPGEWHSEVEVKKGEVYGFADLVGKREVIDIKSIRSWGMKVLEKKDADVIKDKYTYILQTATYAYLLDKPIFRIMFIDKDSLKILEYSFLTEQWRQEVLDELHTLNGYWAGEILPPARPRAYSGKECNYCVFADKCKAVEEDFKQKQKTQGQKEFALEGGGK